jgi:hypothetical protein
VDDRSGGASVGPISSGIGGEKVTEDSEVARKVVAFLEHKVLLFSERQSGNERECVSAAAESRAFITAELTTAKPGESLASSLRAMRAALRTFVDAGGPGARNFTGSRRSLSYCRALETLQALVGLQLATIVDRYDIQINPAIARMLARKTPADEG